jgi:hypothetical protein
MTEIKGARMEEQICLNCSLWIPQEIDIQTGYCRTILHRDKNWLKGAEKRYSDSCSNFEPRNEKQNESENEFSFI